MSKPTSLTSLTSLTSPTYKTTHCTDYNAALKRRGSLTSWFDPGMDWYARHTVDAPMLPHLLNQNLHYTLGKQGVVVQLLAALAGHAHISTTQRYIDINSDQLRQAVELL